MVSRLSRHCTIAGVTVEIRIYRFEDEPQWVLVVINEAGTHKVWDEVFPSETEALEAFQNVVREQGMEIFLENDGTATLH